MTKILKSKIVIALVNREFQGFKNEKPATKAGLPLKRGGYAVEVSSCSILWYRVYQKGIYGGL